MINHRQQNLLDELLKADSYFPVSHYAKILEVSQRTLYNDLKIIETIIKEKGDVIKRKRGLGIKLSKGNMFSTLHNHDDFEFNTDNLSPPILRQTEILRLLLFKKDPISYQQLSEKFYVSKTTIANDFNIIENVIKKTGVKINFGNNGSKISSNESEIQIALKKYIYYLCDEYSSNSSIKLYCNPYVFKLLSCDVLLRVKNKLQQNKEINLIRLSDDHFDSLVLTVSIFITRQIEGFHIEDQNHFLFEDIELMNTFFLTSEITGLIENITNIKVLKNDFDFLNSQLIALGLETNLLNLQSDDTYSEMLEKLIGEMSNMLNINLKQDETLFKNLYNHFVPMMYRLKTNSFIRNPILNELKSEYSTLFSTTYFALSSLELDLDIILPEDEVAFLMIHFQVAIDKIVDRKRILVVCPTGIGMSELISNRLKSNLFPKDIIEIVSIRKLYQYKIENIDLIISSVKLSKKIDKPIVYVNPLLTNEDLQNIFSKYLTITSSLKSIKENKFENLGKFIYKDFIFLNEQFSTKQQCIKKISDTLIENQFVTNDFEKMIWTRENMGATDLDSEVAIPHPHPKVVNNSIVVVLSLEKPIRWDSKVVRFIFMVCISENDLHSVKDIMSELYNLIESKKKVRNFFLGKSKKDIFEMLTGG